MQLSLEVPFEDIFEDERSEYINKRKGEIFLPGKIILVRTFILHVLSGSEK